jgi:hypothetical protein
MPHLPSAVTGTCCSPGQQKIGIDDIEKASSQQIRGHPGYHILALKLKGRRSELFLYWFPAQYVGAVKMIVGA